jgi:hypothetical protein
MAMPALPLIKPLAQAPPAPRLLTLWNQLEPQQQQRQLVRSTKVAPPPPDGTAVNADEQVYQVPE